MSRLCMYCLRTDSEVEFNREHLIPQSIGGKLFIDDFVCSNCNSFLGSSVDSEILKLPDVLQALRQLKIPHDRTAILNRYYKIKGISETLELPAAATDSGYELRNVTMPDGSVVVSEFDLKKVLAKTISRDERLKHLDVSNSEVGEEIQNLLKEYDKAHPGEKIEWPALGRTLMKHSGKFKFKIVPDDQVNVERLVAKIAYEFILFVGATRLNNNLGIVESLRRQIATGDSQNPIFVTRIESPIEEIQPVHVIALEIIGNMTRVEVVFFGNIDFVLVGPPLSEHFFRPFDEKYGIKGARGVLYEQDIGDTRKKFGLFMEDGAVMGLL